MAHQAVNSRLFDNSAALEAAEAKLKSERKRYQAELSQVQNVNIELQKQVNSVGTRLEAAMKKLSSLEPSSIISDREIALSYEDLNQSIEDWVDSNCGQIQRLSSKVHGHEWGDQNRKDLDDLLDRGAAIQSINADINFGDQLLMKLVMRYLFEMVLRKARWVPGMSAEQEETLQVAMDNLSTVFPERGVGFKNTWRCETYKSLMTSPKVQALRKHHLAILVRKLSNMMAVFVDDKEKFDNAGILKIVNDAAELADKMRRCPVHYTFVYAFVPQMNVKVRRVTSAVMERMSLIDVNSKLSVNDVVLENGHKPGLAGEVICVVLPSLVKLKPDGTIVRLVKGTGLANIHPSSNAPKAADTVKKEVVKVVLSAAIGENEGSHAMQPALPNFPRTMKALAAPGTK